MIALSIKLNVAKDCLFTNLNQFVFYDAKNNTLIVESERVRVECVGQAKVLMNMKCIKCAEIDGGSQSRFRSIYFSKNAHHLRRAERELTG